MRASSEPDRVPGSSRLSAWATPAPNTAITPNKVIRVVFLTIPHSVPCAQNAFCSTEHKPNATTPAIFWTLPPFEPSRNSTWVFECCSDLVDLVVGVGRHLGGGHRLALVGERFVGPLAEDLAQVGARYETDFRESQMRSFSMHLHARRALASASRPLPAPGVGQIRVGRRS